MDLFEPLIVQEKRHVEVDIAENLTVWADESRLKQVLRNLIANALRYSPPSTTVVTTVAVVFTEEAVRFSSHCTPLLA